jgi:hypothetical protein
VQQVKNIKLFVGAGVLLAVVLVGITAAIIPVLVSSDWVKNIVVNKVNSGSTGELSLGDCGIGWSEGLECTAVAYRDAEQGYRLDVARLTSTQGLFSLIMAPKNLGTITADDPVLVLDQAPAESAAADTNAVSQETTEIQETGAQSAQNVGGKDADTGTWFWHKMGGKLLLKRVVVRMKPADKEPSVLLREGFLDLALASNTLNFNFSLKTGAEKSTENGTDNGKGDIKAAGVVKLPSVKGSLMDLLTADMQLTLTDVQTEPFLALAPADGSVPRGQGKLSAELTVKNTEGGNLVVRGPVTLADIDMTGGFLAEDHPRVEQLAFELHLHRDELKNWQFPELKMISDFGTLNLNSSTVEQGFQVRGKGKVELPVLLAQFPHLLKAQENLRLESGLVTVTIDLKKERKNLADKEPEVEKLALKASFLDIQGKGNLKKFTLNGSADLDKAVKEISRIIQFDWDVKGKLKLAVQTEKQAGKQEGKPSGTDGADRYAVSTQIDIADFQFSQQGRTVLPSHQLRFNGKLNTPGTFPEAKADAVDFTFDIASWAGELSGTIDGFYREKGHIMAHYQLNADLLLARVTELLHRYEIVEQETSIAGAMKLRTSGYTEKNRLVLSEFDSRIKDFILYRQGRIFREPDLHLFTTKPAATLNVEDAVRPLEKADSKDIFFAEGGGYNLIDTLNHRLVLRNLTLTSGVADIKAERLFLENWQQKPAPAIKELQVSGSSDLGKLTTLLQQLGVMRPEQKLGGDAVFALDLTEKKEEVEIAGKTNRGNSGTVKLDLERFTYSKVPGKAKGAMKSKAKSGKEKLLIERQKLVFRSHLHGDLMAGDVQFTTFDIESSPLSMQANGELRLSGKERYFSLDGYSTPDLASLVAVLNGMYPLGLAATGKKKEKFSLYYPLSPEEKEKAKINLRFATKLYADSFSKSGIDISELTMDTSMKDGVMTTVLKGALNQGWVQVSPRIDYTRTPPLLTLAKSEQILTDVQLEQALTDGLLKAIHPIFGALATPSGAINARMERFSLPLKEKGLEEINFNLTLDLSGVSLQPKGVLSSILEMAGYADRSLSLKNKNMTCDGAKGKITCTPIKITIADSEMVISGSAGLDGSLDYVVEVPVTRRLLGKKGYEMLKGTTLKVPVRGSREKPVYSRKALMRASSDLLKQAAGQATRNVIQEQVDKVVPDLVPDLLEGLFGK